MALPIHVGERDAIQGFGVFAIALDRVGCGKGAANARSAADAFGASGAADAGCAAFFSRWAAE